MSGLERRENSTIYIWLLLAVFALGGCNSAKHLEEGQSFLESNSTSIRSEAKVRNKSSLKSGLEDQYRQSQTRTFIGIPRHTFYYAGQNNPKDRWFKRWLHTKLGDPPVLYDSTLAAETVRAMHTYLQQRGYWDNTVDFNAVTEGHRTSVQYSADPGKRWTISSIEYIAPDSSIQEILDESINKSFLEAGEPVDIELMEKEQARVTRLLQNAGYANFYQNYISTPLADSSDHRMDLTIEIQPPADAGTHQTYNIGEIRVYPDFTNEAPISVDTIIDSIRFLSPEYPMLVKPETILRQIFISTGELYNRDRHEKTLRQLNKIETYSFVSARPTINPEDSTILDFDIYLNRNKRMGIGGDIEINYSTLDDISRRSLFGLGGNINYRNRNLLRGGEFFSTSLESSVEFNLKSPGALINSLSLSLQNNLWIPRFIDPLHIYRGLNAVRIGKNGILGDKVLGWIRDDNSKFNVGYQYLSLIDLYSYHSVNLSFGYDALPDNFRRLQLNHMGVEFFLPIIEPAFEEVLETNEFLRQSFTRQLFTGLIFKDYLFEVNRPKSAGDSRKFIHSSEISGLEVFVINLIENAIAGRQQKFEFVGNDGDTLDFAHFAKFEADWRHYEKLRGNQEVAFRATAGLAFPYGPYSRQVPYVKQFYIGGPQSIRAWQIRELGPGGYEDPNVDENTVQFYQTGDIKLEMSVEYRFRIGTILANRMFLNGAFFVDAGNVWTLKQDPDRPNSNFTTNFLQQIAVGTGFGFRVDFRYFQIRWDLGYKLRNPYPNEDGDYWLWSNFNNFSFRQFNSNFAIGYPF